MVASIRMVGWVRHSVGNPADVLVYPSVPSMSTAAAAVEALNRD